MCLGTSTISSIHPFWTPEVQLWSLRAIGKCTTNTRPAMQHFLESVLVVTLHFVTAVRNTFLRDIFHFWHLYILISCLDIGSVEFHVRLECFLSCCWDGVCVGVWNWMPSDDARSRSQQPPSCGKDVCTPLILRSISWHQALVFYFCFIKTKIASKMGVVVSGPGDGTPGDGGGGVFMPSYVEMAPP